MPFPALSVRDLCFSYRETEVLHNVSFEIPEKAFVAVVGPNGGGKTTLLRLLIGALTPRFGTISVLGETPTTARRRIGLVPQHATFDPDFPATVEEIVLTGLVARSLFGGFRKAEREAARAALARTGLDGFADRPYAALSGGQRQRVVLARALVSEPDMLLLDEPTANVDRETERALTDLFSEFAREKTVVLVSHNLSIVAARATHILCVNRTADLHVVGQDDATHLEPLHGHEGLAFVRNLDPDHIEHLVRELATPHAGCADHGHGHDHS